MKQQDDRDLFASKFQDFGAVPSNAVWSGIEAALPEKKKKRFVLLWWTSGIAASLLTSGLIFFSNLNETRSQSEKTWHTNSAFKDVQDPTKSKENQSLMSTDSNENALITHNVSDTLESQISPENSLNISYSVMKYNALDPALPFVDEMKLEGSHVEMKDSSEQYVERLNKRNGFSKWGSTNSNSHRLFTQQLPSRHEMEKPIKHWWLGVFVEQSNRVTPLDIVAEVQGLSSSPNAYAEVSNSNSKYNWNRIQNVELLTGFDWTKRWSFGTGFEYGKWDNIKNNETSTLRSHGQSIGIPLSVTYQIIAKHHFKLGAQIDFRQRFVYNYLDSVPSSGVPDYTIEVETNYQFPAYQRFNGFQSQVGIGLSMEVPFLNRFRWNTVVEYQHSIYRNAALQNRINGSWMGLKTGIVYCF